MTAAESTMSEGIGLSLPRVYLRVSKGGPSSNLLCDLRALTPRRGLSPAESREVAERQAFHLLKRAGIGGPAIPTSALENLEGIEVAYRDNWPTSGLTRQLVSGWAVFIRSSEPKVRQRFTLAHELKHIIDDPLVEWLYPTVGDSSPEDRGRVGL